MKKDGMTYTVSAPDAMWKDFNEPKICKNKGSALRYIRWLRVRWGHLAILKVVFASGCSVACNLRAMWSPVMPKWIAMGPPPTSWVT